MWSLGKTCCPEELHSRQELRGSGHTSQQGERVECTHRLPAAAVQVQRKESMPFNCAANERLEPRSEALKKVNQILENVFVDAELHYIAFTANPESGNKEKAEFHKAVIRGILDSIQENKRGQSEEDAFVVINVHEEYTFLRFSNMQVTKQSLSHKDGHTYDIMVCKNMSREEREVTAYFNVDIPTQSLRDALAN